MYAQFCPKLIDYKPCDYGVVCPTASPILLHSKCNTIDCQWCSNERPRLLFIAYEGLVFQGIFHMKGHLRSCEGPWGLFMGLFLRHYWRSTVQVSNYKLGSFWEGINLVHNKFSSLLHKLGLLEWLWCNLRWRQSYTFQVLKQNDFNGDALSNPVAHFFTFHLFVLPVCRMRKKLGNYINIRGSLLNSSLFINN